MSYDPVEGLRKFADAHGITYRLLSDEGSRVITELGLLDRRLKEHHDAFGVPTRDDQYGVAYPITFVLDERGVVTRRIVEESYRVRESGARVLERIAGGRATVAGPAAEGRTDSVHVSASLAEPTYFAYRRQDLRVRLDIAEGWHVYGPAVPDGYRALAVSVASAPAGVRAEAIAWPSTTPFRVEGLPERFEVYTGTVELAVPLVFVVQRGSGEVTLDIAVDLQTCSATECLPPSRVSVRLAVPEAPVPA